MSSRADLMHLDFIIAGWNMLCYHSCYLLREMEDSRRIQLSRGCLPSFPMLFWVCLASSSHFPSCSSSNFDFISAPASEVLCVYAKSMFGILVKTEVKTEVLVSALTSSVPYLDDPPTASPPPFTLLRNFPLPLPCLVDARKSQSLVRALPVLPPGHRAPSHMPRRLARSSEPLY